MVDKPQYRVGKRPMPGDHDEYFTSEQAAETRCYELNKGRSGSDPNAAYDVYKIEYDDNDDDQDVVWGFA